MILPDITAPQWRWQPLIALWRRRGHPEITWLQHRHSGLPAATALQLRWPHGAGVPKWFWSVNDG